MTKILFFSRDPGGTNQLVALRSILSEQDEGGRNHPLFDRLNISGKPNIIVVAKDYAHVIWRQNGFEALDWPDILSEEEVAGYLAGFSPDHIITSSCHVDDRTEQMVWRVARQLAIKVTAFLDSHHNIAVRFKDDQGEVILPDQVSVIDEVAMPALISLGFAKKNIFVSGDLYQNYFISSKRYKSLAAREWGGQEGESLILFASDYIHEMQAMGLTFEVTEFECLDRLIDILTTGERREYLKGHCGPYRLIIRPHPKDTPGKYEAYPQKSTRELTILISSIGASLEAVTSADLVTGLGSSLLNEAKALGVGILALGPLVKKCKDSQKTIS
ncbi:MAG: hypothetical protein L3J58_10190 [Emcibacter sp.]|nr:hypothetical protein [Emcibacter sp.]